LPAQTDDIISLKFREAVALLLSHTPFKQKEIAEKLGIPPTYLSHLLNDRPASKNHLFKLEEVFTAELADIRKLLPSGNNNRTVIIYPPNTETSDVKDSAAYNSDYQKLEKKIAEISEKFEARIAALENRLTSIDPPSDKKS